MRKISAGILLLALTTSADAQQVMDGSEKNIPAAIWMDAKQAVTENLSDPYSTQFDRLRPTSSDATTICGRFNAKNQAGGYVGFRPFSFSGTSRDLSVNETNECGKGVFDQAEYDRTMADCSETGRQLSQYLAGRSTGKSLAEMRTKLDWCVSWGKRAQAQKIEMLGGKP